MKEATIILSLTKDHQFPKHGVTPIEAIVLTAIHHKNVGGSPVAVDKATVKDIPAADRVVKKPAKVGVKKVGTKVVGKKKSADGKTEEDIVEDTFEDVFEDREFTEKGSRTVDEELARLRVRYGSKVVDTISSKFRDLPTEDYDKAVQLGTQVMIPTGKMDNVIAEVK